jgi:hypothetical protein
MHEEKKNNKNFPYRIKEERRHERRNILSEETLCMQLSYFNYKCIAKGKNKKH